MDDDISVLVVDEDEDVLELTETFLERESDAIEVETETSARNAVERIEDGGVDCVVSDYRMPGMDGMDLFEAVDEREPSLPFLLFSAAVDDETVSEAESAGVTAFVQKGAGTEHYRRMASIIEDAVGD
jgi:DNA-binding NtrC family response regulator